MIVTAVAFSAAVREIKTPRYAKDLGESQVIAGGAERTRTPDPPHCQGRSQHESDLAML